MEDLLKGSPISTRIRWSSVLVTLGFLLHSLAKARLRRLLSLARLPGLGRFLVVPNFFHLHQFGVSLVNPHVYFVHYGDIIQGYIHAPPAPGKICTLVMTLTSLKKKDTYGKGCLVIKHRLM